MHGKRVNEEFHAGLDKKQGFPPRSKSTPLERFPSITRTESGDYISDNDDEIHGETLAVAVAKQKQKDKNKNAQRNPYLSSLGKCRSENQVSEYDRKLFANALPWIPMTKTWQMRMHGKEEKQIDRRVGPDSMFAFSAWLVRK